MFNENDKKENLTKKLKWTRVNKPNSWCKTCMSLDSINFYTKNYFSFNYTTIKHMRIFCMKLFFLRKEIMLDTCG
jgi:hypothetical protein